jgi:ATP-dependent protease HslVU (ClpYQ) peptidase subunit
VTTVAALARDGAVYMAADSSVNIYDRAISGGVKKIRRIKTGDAEILIGCSGNAGLPGVVDGRLKVDAVPTDGQDPQPWADAIAFAVTSLAAEHHLFDDGSLDGHLILGWGGRVWSINTSVAVAHADGIAAIGSGEGLAVGAIDALLANTDADPPRIVTEAVMIACRRDRYSEPPIQVEYLPPVKSSAAE